MTAVHLPGRFGRRARILRENLTAYAFLLPAAVLIFIFGLFPLAFAFFVSLHRWRRLPGNYNGLTNYHSALGDFAYVAFFWLGAGALALAGYLIWRALRVAQRRGWLFALPGLLNAGAMLLVVDWFFRLLPIVLRIPSKLLGQKLTRDLFLNEFFASFRVPAVAEAGGLALAALIIAVLVSLLMLRYIRLEDHTGLLLRWTGAFLAAGIGLLILQLTFNAIGAAVSEARAQNIELPIWSQIILISAGAALLVAAYWLWGRAVRQPSDRRLVAFIPAVMFLMLGGYLLVAQAPGALAESDTDMLNAFSVTIMYSFGAVPFQLAIGLTLAYLLFQNLKGKTLFRMIFFLPYIMPFLATAMVFTLLFSHRQESIINHLIGAVGIAPQKWLLEPLGVGKLVFGPQTPNFLAGPPLALVVVMIYTVWTYSGYATVVFLAGLSNISGELYEAARIDGASGWAVFRYITLPLLSPTTFFLTLIAVIGTFQAFTQLWIMRTPAAGKSIDTMGVYIFTKLRDADPSYGYGAALSFVLFGVILVLTLVQNRIAQRRVFYG
jgi:multiple sugar transport system permease protein